MDTQDFLTLLKESIFMISVFAVFMMYAMAKGRYALINVIFALYLALLVSLEFPYYKNLMTGAGDGAAFAKILVFLAFVIAATVLMRRHIPGDDYEPAFNGFHKKIILSLMCTVLVMAFSFHALPVTEIITPGTPIQALFAPQQYFFWWLALPIIVLFFV